MIKVNQRLAAFIGSAELQADESAVCRLLSAAIKKGNVITDAKVLDGSHFSFTLKGEGRPYVLSIGRNPDRAKYPTAERALRGSEMVEDLLSLIRLECSCYVMPSGNITPPDTEKVKKALFGPGSDARVEYKNEVTSASARIQSNYSYELEVEIRVQIGDSFESMVDYLGCDVSGGNVTYTYKPFECSGFFKEGEDLESRSFDPTEAEEQISVIRTVIEGGEDTVGISRRRNENTGAMLSAFALSADSEFSKFLVRVSEKENVSVGQITVTPCSVIIGAMTEKLFEYSVSIGGAKPVSFKLAWNQSGALFNEKTPFYMLTEDSELIGFTYEKEYVKNGAKALRTPYGGELLVAAHAIEKGVSYPAHLALAAPEVGYKDIFYKGVKNYAVMLDGRLGKGIDPGVYYSVKYTALTDGGRYPAEELGECAATRSGHWKGALEKLTYVAYGPMNKMELRSGLIYTQALDKCVCDICAGTYYADKKMLVTYKNAHKLISGENFCDKCTDLLQKNGSTYKKLAVRENASDKLGWIYALVDGKEECVHPDVGGNVYSCCNCDRKIYYAGEADSCPTCGELICNSCLGGGEIARNKIYNSPLRYCQSCKPVAGFGKPITRSEVNKGKRTYKVLSPKGKDATVLDAAFAPETVFHCAVCQAPTLFNGSENDYARCKCCNRLLHKDCVSKLTRDPFGNLLCPGCAARMDGEYENAVSEMLTKIERVKAKRVKIETDEKAVLDNFLESVKQHIGNYLPFLPLRARLRISKAIKAGDAVPITVSVKDAVTHPKYKSTKVDFSIKLKGFCGYRFVTTVMPGGYHASIYYGGCVNE